ncbi:hypothetical protein [Cetobacterium sp.]|uniref:hypothetical protein n=1 Tax=Cetobacterium sp. TaxID=2071632 RepID=UPI003F3FBC12
MNIKPELIEKIIEEYLHLSKTKIKELEDKVEEHKKRREKTITLSIQLDNLTEKYNEVTNGNEILKTKIRELENKSNS